jgi:hypothetical protein
VTEAKRVFTWSRAGVLTFVGLVRLRTIAPVLLREKTLEETDPRASADIKGLRTSAHMILGFIWFKGTNIVNIGITSVGQRRNIVRSKIVAQIAGKSTEEKHNIFDLGFLRFSKRVGRITPQ